MPEGELPIALAKLVGLCVVAGTLVAGMLLPFAGGLGYASNQANDTLNSASSELVTGQLPMMTTVTDKDGAPIAYLYDQYRIPVASQDISQAMKDAVVAIEDKRFYQNRGVDWQSTVRALVRNETAGDIKQGASTITQQYVKNYLLYVVAKTESERLKAIEPSYARKLKEARIAVALERHLSKQEILTRYLDIVYLGNNTYGVGAAARTYFATTPEVLTVPQAALLAGMVQSPAAYDPVTHPQAAASRRDEVIRQMREQGMIDKAQATAALAAPLGVVTPVQTPPNGCLDAGDAGFFCKYVVDYLANAGISAETLDRGGYTIRTTLDRTVLAKTKAALDAEVPPATPHVADVMSVVAPGQDKHRVLAMAANRVFGLDAGKLQTSYGLPFEPVPFGVGSVNKIFTAAVALKKGMGINSTMVVPPSGYTSPMYKDDSGNPVPVANAGTYPDHLSMQDALATSPNTAFVKLEEFTGVAPVVDMAVTLGLRSLASTPATNQPNSPSLADVIKSQDQASFTLGPTPTSVVELANVGATLGSSGMWCPPTPIESITGPDGNPVPVTEPPCAQAVAPTLANTLMTGLSKDDQGDGTSAAAAASLGWSRPVASKTGTTQQHQSAAFLGFTQGISGAVITFDDSANPQPLCDGGGAPFACGSGDLFGGMTPARTWYRAMGDILANQPVLPLPPTDPRYVNGAQVPNVVGLSVDDATSQLLAAGYTVTQSTVDNQAPSGTVVGQSPTGSLLPGQSVAVQVSDGSPPPPPPIDTGTSPTDTGTFPTDTVPPPTDFFTPPTDVYPPDEYLPSPEPTTQPGPTTEPGPTPYPTPYPEPTPAPG